MADKALEQLSDAVRQAAHLFTLTILEALNLSIAPLTGKRKRHRRHFQQAFKKSMKDDALESTVGYKPRLYAGCTSSFFSRTLDAVRTHFVF
jgi:hypothetical protein